MLDAVFVVLLTLPWLNPFAPGPLSALGPWLFSAACGALVLLVYGVAPALRAREALARSVGRAWALAALLSSALALAQYLGLGAAWMPWVNTASLGEAFANLRQRNQFASLTSLGLVAVLAWVAQAPVRARAGLGVAVLAAVVLGVGNAASSSRTGLLQWGVLVALMLCWPRWRVPRVRWVMLAAVLAYALAQVALPWWAGLDPVGSGAWARLRAGDGVCSSRLTLWGNVLHLIAQKPWLGWGWGALDEAHFLAQYPGARFCDLLDNAHNLPLHLAVTLGVPVALGVCAALGWVLWRARPWRESDARRQMAWAALAVLTVHSLLEYPLWYGPFQLAVGLSGWLLWRRPAWAACKPRKSIKLLKTFKLFKLFRPLALAAPGWVALVLIACIGYTAWDYHRISQPYLRPQQRDAAYRDNPLRHAQASWLFRQPVAFAELTTTPLTPANAAHLHALARSLLSFSPEARVVQTLIDSAELLGLSDEAAFYRARYAAAFPARPADANGIKE